MPETSKKLMTYEALEEYNTKWHERLQNKAISNEELDAIYDDVFNSVPSVDGPSLICQPSPDKEYIGQEYYEIDERFSLTLKFINNGNVPVALLEFAILYSRTDSNPWSEYGEPRIAVIEPGEAFIFEVPSSNLSIYEYAVEDGKMLLEIPYSYSTDLELDYYDYFDRIDVHDHYTIKPISYYFDDEPPLDTTIWQDLPIQDTPIETTDTIYLSFGNSFRYEPSGGGVKRISIVNPKGNTPKFRKFQLEIINGGDFPIEWGENIKWKYSSPPQLDSYHTDVLMFETRNNGKTWVGEVVQTEEMTPYWKFVVVPFNYTDSSPSEENGYNYVPVDIIVPITKDAIEYIDWGDGTIENGSFASIDSSSTFPMHSYSSIKPYTVTIKSSKFNTGYISSYSSASEMIHFNTSLIEIVNPLPHLKGSYQIVSNERTAVDGTFENLFRGYSDLRTIPDTVFKHNQYPIGSMCFKNCNSLSNIPPNAFDNDSNILSFEESFYYCSNLKSIPAGLFDKHVNATSFKKCFYYCYSIQSVPKGLFDKNANAANFSYCFYGCNMLESIPAKLFKNSTEATNFEYCFYNCTSLQSIPAGLFASNAKTTSFKQCFCSCEKISSIPAGLFDSCTLVDTFYSCFSYCYSIKTIPEFLFSKNVNATNFNYCFNSCSALEDFTLHIVSKNVSSCAGFVTSKSECTRKVYVPFNSTTQATFNSVASSLKLTIINE